MYTLLSQTQDPPSPPGATMLTTTQYSYLQCMYIHTPHSGLHSELLYSASTYQPSSNSGYSQLLPIPALMVGTLSLLLYGGYLSRQLLV